MRKGRFKLNKGIKYLIGLCLIFGLHFLTKKEFFAKTYYVIEHFTDLYPLSFFITYLLFGLPIFLFVYLSNQKTILEPLGLRKNPLKGLLYAFLFSLPMFVGYGILSGFEVKLVSKDFWIGCVFAAFFEELYYRGFFFGQIFRKTLLGFFPSLILSALVFASLHLYQSDDFATSIGIFLTTFMGAGLFAWLYVEWEYNLWMPIGLHFFMNLSWTMFDISDNAFGDWSANLIRAATIAFAIIGTIFYKKKQGIPMTINRNTLLIKKEK